MKDFFNRDDFNSRGFDLCDVDDVVKIANDKAMPVIEKFVNLTKETLAQLPFEQHHGYIVQICEKALKEVGECI